MPASPSSSAQAARVRLGEQLRELRREARVSGREFAQRAGWQSASLVTMIEKGQRSISAEHVALWCRICGVSDRRRRELLAEQESVAGMWVTYRELNRGGLKKAQESVRDRYERVRLMRVYAGHVIPGLLQTEAYTRTALEAARVEQQVEFDDVAEAVAERIDRQRVLRRHDARWLFVIEEPVLWQRVVPRLVHEEQLGHLLGVMRLASVSVGIIPLSADRAATGFGVWPEHSFMLADTHTATVELVSGYLSVTHPPEIGDYVRAWERLFPLAVHGERAAALIRSALQQLRPA